MTPQIREQLYTMILAADSIAQMQPPSVNFCHALAQVTELLDEMSQEWYRTDAEQISLTGMSCEEVIQTCDYTVLTA